MIKTIDEAVDLLNEKQFMKMIWSYHESRCSSLYQSHVTGHYSNVWEQSFDVVTTIAIARSLNGDYEALEAENASLSSKLERYREAAAYAIPLLDAYQCNSAVNKLLDAIAFAASSTALAETEEEKADSESTACGRIGE